MARYVEPTTAPGFWEDPQEIGRDLDPPKLTYRWAQEKAMERGDAPTYFMRKTEKRSTSRPQKRAARRK